MSMSTYIHGIADAAKLQRAVEARKTLNELGLEYPDELDDIIEDSIAIPYTKVPDEYKRYGKYAKRAPAADCHAQAPVMDPPSYFPACHDGGGEDCVYRWGYALLG